MAELNTNIPQFGLYGEAVVDDPALVHIENIASRSRENGWLIKPHRHGRMFQLLFVFDGHLDITIDEDYSSLKAPCVISLPAGVVHGFKFSPETEGAVLTLAEPLLTNESYIRCEPYFGPLFAKARLFSLEGRSDVQEMLAGYLKQIEVELRAVHLGHKLITEWLSRSVLMLLRRLMLENEEQGVEVSTTPVVQYRKLIESYLLQHWSVEQYADALSISADHLTRLCKAEVGKTAKAIVQERLLLEAKRRLIYTRGSVEELAFGLGFKDAAYFSRFFKQATGETPASFRKNNNFDTY